MQVVLSFILGGCFGVAFMTIFSVNAYNKQAEELKEEKDNNKALANTIEEIRKEKEEDGRN